MLSLVVNVVRTMEPRGPGTRTCPDSYQLVPVGSSWTSTSRRSAGGLRVVPACSSVAQTQAVPLIASNYRFASVSVATDHNPSEDVQGVFLLVFLVLARTRRAAVEGRRSSITSAAAPDGAQVLFVSPETPPLQRRDKRVQPPPPGEDDSQPVVTVTSSSSYQTCTGWFPPPTRTDADAAAVTSLQHADAGAPDAVVGETAPPQA